MDHTLAKAPKETATSLVQSEFKVSSGKTITLSQNKNVKGVLGLSLSSRALIHGEAAVFSPHVTLSPDTL